MGQLKAKKEEYQDMKRANEDERKVIREMGWVMKGA
jgi:hypothetical protein